MSDLPVRDFWELVLAHRGKTFAVMGGAPSLADHLNMGVEADVWISANHHGILLREADYLLCMDQEVKQFGNTPFPEFVRPRSNAKIISPYHWADHQLVTWPQCPRLVLSGMVATWAAWMMGAKAVYLLGMDGYGGDPGYVHEARKMSLEVHCPVRVVGGGPLSKVWPEYTDGEKFGRYKEHSAIRGWLGIDEKITIECRKPTTIRGIEMKPGQRMSLFRHEAKRALAHKMVLEV
jgi:hypothetical protein